MPTWRKASLKLAMAALAAEYVFKAFQSSGAACDPMPSDETACDPVKVAWLHMVGCHSICKRHSVPNLHSITIVSTACTEIFLQGWHAASKASQENGIPKIALTLRIFGQDLLQTPLKPQKSSWYRTEPLWAFRARRVCWKGAVKNFLDWPYTPWLLSIRSCYLVTYDV